MNVGLDHEPSTPRAGEILRVVHARPGIARSDMAAVLGLSSGLASDLVARLVAARQLSEGDPVPTGARGRPTRSLGPHPDGPLVAVAGIAHEDWRVEAVQLGGTVVADLCGRHDRRLGSTVTAVREALGEIWRVYPGRVRAFAVSVPGTVSATRLVQAPNLGWQGVELGTLVPAAADSVGLLAGNDASFSALGELARGAAARATSSLHLFIDSGIGGALVDRGRVTTGAHGMAGEFGHMPFGSRRTRCRCGARGCWNTELDGNALARGLGQPPPADEVSFSRAVLAAARVGHRGELRAVRRAAAALGRGTAGLVNATDPQLVVLSGLAAEMLATAPQALHRAYRDGLMETRAAERPDLVAGALGDRGPLVGAMEAAFAPVLARPAL